MKKPTWLAAGRLRRFPYVVYYEVHGDEVVVLAVWHLRRNPLGWRDRLSS